MDNLQSPYSDPSGLSDPYNLPMDSLGSLSGMYPQRMDPETFRLRNDPEPLLKRYRLQLMNAYEEYYITKDKETGEEKEHVKLVMRQGTVPKANKQGVEDIISYVEKMINNHSVQGNLPTMEDYNDRMLSMSQDLTIHFMCKRKDWGIMINDVDFIIAEAINLIDMFLTRTINNKERESYGESFKETTNRNIMPVQKPNIFQRTVGMMTGSRGRSRW